MNLFRSPLTRLAACLAFSSLLVGIAAAQRVISTPYSLENGGMIEAIWWDVTGGQDAAPLGLAKSRYLSITTGGCSLHDNAAIYRWLAGNCAGNATPYSCMMARGGPRQSTSVDGTYSHKVSRLMPDRVVFPGGDASLKEARNVVITATPELMEADPAYAANPNVNKFARKQKAWLCSNFRLRLGDLPCSRVTQFDPLVIELRQVGDLDSDGSPDMAVHVSDVAFEIPYEDSPLFMEEFKKSQSGSPSSLPLVVDYLDDDGFLLISVAMTVQIRSVGPNDIFTDPAATKKPPVKVSTHSGESKPLQIKVTY